MIWVISDLHLNHKNIIDYCGRPFSSVEEMNQAIINNWNSVVKPEDTVYCLGDMCLGLNTEIPNLISQLKGKIILIRGNHDSNARIKIYQDLGIEIKDIAYLPYKGLYFLMCHFPMTNTDFLDMVVEDNSEVVIVHGHVHDKTSFFTPEYHSFNVSCDVTDFTPVSIYEMWNIVKKHFEQTGVWRKEEANK